MMTTLITMLKYSIMITLNKNEIELFKQIAPLVYEKKKVAIDIREAKIIRNDKYVAWVAFKDFGVVFNKEGNTLIEY